jgi:hypothetical protein
VTAGALSQVREVSGGSGFHSQDSLPVEFGLGAYVGTATVTVHWPNGQMQTLTNVATNRIITLTEPVSHIGAQWPFFDPLLRQ